MLKYLLLIYWKIPSLLLSDTQKYSKLSLSQKYTKVQFSGKSTHLSHHKEASLMTKPEAKASLCVANSY